MAYSITEDDYFQKQQPAKSEELINVVEVVSLPLKIPEVKDWNPEVYKSREVITFASLEAKTIEIKFSDIPVKDPVAVAYITDSVGTLTQDDDGHYTNSTMGLSASYYAWGASLVITNPVADIRYCIIVCGGYPLKEQGKLISDASDDDSILENGELKYKLQDNHLIQSQIIAQLIADTLLATYVIPRKDVTLNWRGDMRLELQDEIIVPEYNKNGIYTEGIFTVYKQKTDYDGGVRQITEGRKLSNILFKSVADNVDISDRTFMVDVFEETYDSIKISENVSALLPILKKDINDIVNVSENVSKSLS